MDRLSFVFSLLLIVSVTTSTFGSVIKAKNPNGESLVESLSDPDLFPNMAPKGQNGLKDQESEKSKRDDPVTLIPGPTTVALLEERVETNLACGVFQIAICVENLSGYKWTQPSMHHAKGTELILPDHILADERVLTSSSGDEGVGGVLVYDIEHLETSLAIMYLVDNHDRTEWCVKLTGKETAASKTMYDEMLEEAFQVKNDEWYPDQTLSDSLMYRLRMSTNHRARLEIQIFESKVASGM